MKMKKIFIAAAIVCTQGTVIAQVTLDSIKVKQLEDVTVIAQRGSAKAPFTKNSLNQTEIEKLNLGQDIPFLLNQMPNVIINSDAGNGVGYTGIRIRGTDATRINMTINGVPYNDAESQGIFFVNLPDLLSSVNSIEVQRGVGSSSNGVGAFGATLSLNTNQPNNKPYLTINNSVGSFNTLKNTIKFGTNSNQKFYFDGRISHIKSDGYIDRASTNLKSGLLSFGYKNKNTTAKFNAILGNEKTYQAWYGVNAATLATNRTYNAAGTEKPDAPYPNEIDHYTQNHYQFIVNHNINNNWKIATTSFYTRGKGFYEQYKHQAPYQKYGLPNFTIGTQTLTTTDLVRQLWLNNHYYGQSASAIFEKNKQQLTFNIFGSQYDGAHYGQIPWAAQGIAYLHNWYNLKSKKTDISSFVKWQTPIHQNAFFYTDVQVRNVHYQTDGFRNNPNLQVKQQYAFLNPKLGFFITGNNSYFAASYAKGTKEPNREDFETNTIQIPKPEKLHDWELNYKIQKGRLAIQATYYYMYYIDQLILSGKINDVGAYTRQNVDQSYRTGIELQGNYRFSKKLTLNSSINYSANKIKQFTAYIDDYDNGGQIAIVHQNKNIAYTPNLVANAFLNIKPITQLEIQFLSKYVGKQYLDNTQSNNKVLDNYYTQDVIGIYTPKVKVLKQVQIIGQINNVFNKKYEPNGYTFSYFSGGQTIDENYYFPMSGTNFMLGINIDL
jgi:iron complex outermembrane recepter protein